MNIGKIIIDKRKKKLKDKQMNLVCPPKGFILVFSDATPVEPVLLIIDCCLLTIRVIPSFTTGVGITLAIVATQGIAPPDAHWTKRPFSNTNWKRNGYKMKRFFRATQIPCTYLLYHQKLIHVVQCHMDSLREPNNSSILSHSCF